MHLRQTEIDGVSDKAENASIWHALLSNVWLQLKGGGGGVGEEPPTQWRNKEEEAEPVWGHQKKNISTIKETKRWLNNEHH